MPTSSYSKAARGLFALLRLNGIFTVHVISPEPLLRQYPNHYAIHAGRNLPDKEFRYLRTVIVTAAVHQGLESRLAPLLVTFWHWAGISLYTSSCDFAQTCVFDKQLLGFFRCDLIKDEAVLIPKLRTFLLPSSLTAVNPIT